MISTAYFVTVRRERRALPKLLSGGGHHHQRMTVSSPTVIWEEHVALAQLLQNTLLKSLGHWGQTTPKSTPLSLRHLIHGHRHSLRRLSVGTAASPSFAPAPEDLKVVEGHSVTFTCRVYGAPRPQLEWRHESTPVFGRRFRVHDSGDLEIRVNSFGCQLNTPRLSVGL